ncbi:allergenic cerato-platanin Asp F13 [Aspergillus sclerotioniger CBS 115572]|uniref:Allergenic cerato-platanin Asp F13 n=1 Tax=Aspergillus sclerotioniger CBS 115572 TaxID=1450535 RepID=A0A317WTA1_9EURO|nr:allergenic cerato-platanin Asp F13 [Aspergillus sclerotioniger CBS 115572]PWY89586.1 allergenic cerato-platanin Asp F13 [Aspergillus sclerotioniger CBS 115572]
MKTFTVAFSLISLFSSALAMPADAAATGTSVSVSYDTKYDDSNGSLSTTACSDGANGLVTKGYPTFGSLPNFPNIGGALTIPSWNSPNCGACYALEYQGTIVYITAVDTAPSGFNIGLDAMNTLTNGQAVDLGRITATYTPVDASFCKMSD